MENINFDDKTDTLEEAEKLSILRVIEENKALAREKLAKSPNAKLTPAQWREIELLWESGEVTLKDLSERYGKNPEAFSQHFRKNKIRKGSRVEELRRVAEKIQREQAENDLSTLSKRIRDTKEQHYKMADAIARLTFNEVLNARQRGVQFRDIQQDIKSLQLAADTLKKCREERWVILGLDKDAIDEDALPELVMSTMTPEQALEMRRAQEEDDEEMGIDDDILVMQSDE